MKTSFFPAGFSLLAPCLAGCPSKKLKDDSSSEILSTVAEHFDELLKLFAFMCFQYGFGFRDAADLSSAIRVSGLDRLCGACWLVNEFDGVAVETKIV